MTNLFYTKMIGNAHPYELEAAAIEINLESLQIAKSAIIAGCEDYLRWAAIFLERLETIQPVGLHKFARALALTELGYLPTRPGTCPFCIQYGKDRSCEGCGYARTHGRCDSATSAFSRFIEAFQEFGRVIYQDTSPDTIRRSLDSDDAREVLRESIDASARVARRMLSELPDASTFRLMELKARYLDEMICLIPISLLSDDAYKKQNNVRECLISYW